MHGETDLLRLIGLLMALGGGVLIKNRRRIAAHQYGYARVGTPAHYEVSLCAAGGLFILIGIAMLCRFIE